MATSTKDSEKEKNLIGWCINIQRRTFSHFFDLFSKNFLPLCSRIKRDGRFAYRVCTAKLFSETKLIKIEIWWRELFKSPPGNSAVELPTGLAPSCQIHRDSAWWRIHLSSTRPPNRSRRPQRWCSRFWCSFGRLQLCCWGWQRPAVLDGCWPVATECSAAVAEAAVLPAAGSSGATKTITSQLAQNLSDKMTSAYLLIHVLVLRAMLLRHAHLCWHHVLIHQRLKLIQIVTYNLINVFQQRTWLTKLCWYVWFICW